MRPMILRVIEKELKDHFRDRRSLITAAAMAIFSPLLMFFVFSEIGKAREPDRPLPVAVVHAERAPSLMQYLESKGATLTQAPDDYEAQIRSGALACALVVPEDYARDFEGSEPAKVRLLHDSSRQKLGAAADRVDAILRQYAAEIQMMRLVGRGMSPFLMTPVVVERSDLATPAGRAARVAIMMCMFLLSVAFMGGLSAALDTTAGERERGSLESLLLNPVSLSTLVLGKAVAALLVTCVTVLANGVATVWAMHRMAHDLGLSLTLGTAQYVALAAVLLPISCFGVGLQLLIGIFSRSFREAQTYMGLLGMLPILPPMYVLMNPGEPAFWLNAVPFLGHTHLVNGILGGEGMSVAIGVAAVGPLALAAICLASVVYLLRSERVIFGR
jgi:sodium transport system permease protein